MNDKTNKANKNVDPIAATIAALKAAREGAPDSMKPALSRAIFDAEAPLVSDQIGDKFQAAFEDALSLLPDGYQVGQEYDMPYFGRVQWCTRRFPRLDDKGAPMTETVKVKDDKGVETEETRALHDDVTGWFRPLVSTPVARTVRKTEGVAGAARTGMITTLGGCPEHLQGKIKAAVVSAGKNGKPHGTIRALLGESASAVRIDSVVWTIQKSLGYKN